MGTTYTGVPANVSLASAASITVPADADPDNAATFDVGMQKLTDYVEALRTASAPTLLHLARLNQLPILSGNVGTIPWTVDFASAANAAFPAAMEAVMPFSGKISNLRVKALGIAAGGTHTFTVAKNGALQTVTATGNLATPLSDTTHSFTFVAGDTISVQLVNSAGLTVGASTVSLSVAATGA